MLRPLAYICAPYRAETEEDRAANVAIAMTMARVALRTGRLPVVHATIEAGGMGRDDVPDEREAGLKAAEQLASWVAKSGGEIWVRLPASGAPTEGMRRELVAFRLDYKWATSMDGTPAARVEDASGWLRCHEGEGARRFRTSATC
jgi:hypothetical protein